MSLVGKIYIFFKLFQLIELKNLDLVQTQIFWAQMCKPGSMLTSLTFGGLDLVREALTVIGSA